MRFTPALCLLAACNAVVKSTDPDEPCLEAGYAIAYVTEVCTGDVDLANERFHDFERDYECIPRRTGDPEMEEYGVHLEDLYDCSFAIRLLSCDLQKEYGSDLDRYLDASEACSWIVKPRRGGR